MTKKVERTREEMNAFFEAHEGFNDYISKKIMEEEKKQKAAKKKAKKK